MIIEYWKKYHDDYDLEEERKNRHEVLLMIERKAP